MTAWLVGPLAVAGAAALWLAVQRAWLRSFPGPAPDADALAGRPGCGGCGACDREAPPSGSESVEGARCERAPRQAIEEVSS